jgi:hypothetical protein
MQQRQEVLTMVIEHCRTENQHTNETVAKAFDAMTQAVSDLRLVLEGKRQLPK